MKRLITGNLLKLAESCGFPLYIVGGAVRDYIAGLGSGDGDVDICAPASADSLCACAEKCGAHVNAVYRNTGTVKLSFGAEEYEFASFRSDEYVRGTHTPVKTFFTEDITLDARRRDFKCNAVYYDIKGDKYLDPLGGIADIESGRISAVADADKVFGEDGLRLMRLARQSAQTGFIPTEDCIGGALANSGLIADIAPERIYAELDLILHADLKYGVAGGQYKGLEILSETRVLDRILPELTAGRGMEQNPAYHNYDVLGHSLRAVLYADNSVRLAALLHDVGKPYCKIRNGNYHAHEEESARIARDICARYRVGKRLTAETVRLCALHMYDLKCDARESKIRRHIVNNADIYEKLLLVKQADYSACKDDLSVAPCVVKWNAIMEKMKSDGTPFNTGMLAVRGDGLIAEGIPPEAVGKILNLLLNDCAVQPSLNSREKLTERALSYYRTGKF